MTMRAIDIYEKLSTLRQENPEAVEQEARNILNEYFDSIEDEDKRLRLQQLQFRIDGELRHYKDPVARMNKMVELFWDGVKEFQQSMRKL